MTSLTINNIEVLLNKTELEVLISLYNETLECTGGEFGFASDARKSTKLNKNEFAGYISALKSKGVFEYLDTDYSTTYGGQFEFVEDVKEFFN